MKPRLLKAQTMPQAFAFLALRSSLGSSHGLFEKNPTALRLELLLDNWTCLDCSSVAAAVTLVTTRPTSARLMTHLF